MDENKTGANADQISEKKNTSKKVPVIIGIICALIVIGLIAALALGGANRSKPGADTGESGAVSDSVPVTDKNGDTADPADTGSNTPSGDTSGNGGSTEPAGSDNPANPDNPDDPDDNPVPIDHPDDIPEPVVIVTEGAAENAWPADKLPDGVPEFKNIKKFYTCTYQEGNQDEEWFMSWDASKEDFDAWFKKVTDAGFIKSANVVGFYGNGDIIMDIETEDNDDGSTWVSLDVYRTKNIGLPASIASIYPQLKTTAAVWYTTEKDGVYSIYYQCAKDWKADMEAYYEALAAAGFSLSRGKAEKTVDGKTYTVTWNGEAVGGDILSYTLG